MFDIGFGELVLLFGLGLMVLGPERMPKVAAQLGRWAGQARNMARNLTAGAPALALYGPVENAPDLDTIRARLVA